MGTSDFIRVFDADPDLLDGLDERVQAHLRTRMVTRRVWAGTGPWRPGPPPGEQRGHLGLLVLDGLLVRAVRLAGRECSEIVGPGDLVRPWETDELDGSVECVSEWRVLSRATFAVLDGLFAARVGQWPTITSALFSRVSRHCRSLGHQSTIARVRHAETRVLLELWHLADRWGRVTPDGVVVPVPLTHQLLAQLACLQRPTVSTALGRLKRAGELSRLSGGGWLLHTESPAAPLAEGELAA